jgi:soluble P-type ATPase
VFHVVRDGAAPVRRAAKVDRNQAEIVAALRKIGCKVQSLAAVGDGVPDLLVWRPSAQKLSLLECKDGAKRPSERRLTADQERFHADWPVTVVESVEQAIEAVR